MPVARVEPGRVRHFARADAKLAKTDAIDAVLATIQKQIDALDKQTRKLIDADEDFRDDDRLLQSVPGVGVGLSAVILNSLVELGRVTLCKRKAAALIGVAPFNHDSGKHRGSHHLRGLRRAQSSRGRVDVRNAFYMSAYAATKFNPVIKAFAERLTAAGKPFKVVIIACMRKLAGHLNVILRDRLTWDQLAVAKNAQLYRVENEYSRCVTDTSLR